MTVQSELSHESGISRPTVFVEYIVILQFAWSETERSRFSYFLHFKFPLESVRENAVKG